MTESKRTSLGHVGKAIRKQFITGILVTVPVAGAVLILIWLFFTVDNFLQPAAEYLLGHRVAGLGVAMTIVLIYLIGVVAASVVGRRLVRYGESLLSRVPVFRYLYTGIKQIIESFAAPSEAGFLQVVLVEFPKKGMRVIGFVTSESRVESGDKLITVFIPTSPNPTSGYLEIVREADIIRTTISIDDALKMVLSAGKVSLKEVTERLGAEIPREA
jgi:uncharacterized membrane protein